MPLPLFPKQDQTGLEGSARSTLGRSRGRPAGSQGVKGGIEGIPWGHQVGLMSLLMIHEAYMPVYKCSRFFLRTDVRINRGPCGPKNVSLSSGNYSWRVLVSHKWKIWQHSNRRKNTKSQCLDRNPKIMDPNINTRPISVLILKPDESVSKHMLLVHHW